MASVSISHMIIFIASVTVAASVVGVFTDQVSLMSDAIDDTGLDVSKEIRTDIEVISDAGSANCCYNDTTSNTTLLVKNTGSRTLPANPDQVEVLVDGTYDTDVAVTVLDGTDWQVGNVIELTVTEDLTLGEDHRIKVIVNGDEEVFTFRT